MAAAELGFPTLDIDSIISHPLVTDTFLFYVLLNRSGTYKQLCQQLLARQ
jgi:hypothetical protein